MVRYWSKLVCFEDDRITVMAFNLDDERCRENCFSEVIMIMNQMGLGLYQYYNTKWAVDLGLMESIITNYFSEI